MGFAFGRGLSEEDDVRDVKMIHTLRISFVALLLIGLVSAAWCQDVSKVLQAPNLDNLDAPMWDIQSQWDAIDGEPNVIRADNWRCPDGLAVTDVHWWGSYLFNEKGDDPIAGFKFEISIHANGADNLPGSLLYREVFDFAGVNEQLYGTDLNGEDVYEYKVYLTTPFEQIRNNIYWLDIVALTPGQTRWPMWGWHTTVAAQEAALNGSAQTTAPPDSADPSLPDVGANPWQTAQYDLAFELTTIPEPSLVALFGLGIFTVWRRFRQR